MNGGAPPDGGGSVIERIKRRLQLMVGVGRVTAVNDGGAIQKLQLGLLPGEIHDDAMMVGIFGVASCPPIGTDVAVLFPGGNRRNPVVLGTNHAGSRVTGQQPGELAIFNAFGVVVKLGSDKRVTITGAEEVFADAPKLRCSGDIIAEGDVFAGGANGVSLKNHLTTGVQSGAALSGKPQQ